MVVFYKCDQKHNLSVRPARVMAKLSRTSESVISVGLIVLNLDKVLREQLSRLYLWLLRVIKEHWTDYHGSAKHLEKVMSPVFNAPFHTFGEPRLIGYS